VISDKLAHRLLAAFAVVVLVFLFLPILVIFVHSFNGGRLLVSWGGFSLDPYLAVVNKPVVRDAVIVSLRTGAIAAVIATVIGTLAGIALATRPGRWTLWFIGVLVLVSVTPEIVDAVALLPWLVTLGTDWGLPVFNDGTVRLVVGHSLFAIAVVTFVVRSRLVGIEGDLEAASADLYATPARTFWKITVPLALPAVLSGGLLAFTLSLDNTVISAFVSVAGTTPWPVYVFSAVRQGLRPEVAAVSTVMFVLTMFALALVAVVLRRAGESTSGIARTLAG